MKVFIISIALASAATALPLAAQGNGRNVDGVPPGHRPPAGMCRVWIDGVPPGRQSAPTDCGTARARAATNGGRVIYGSSRRNREDCTYDQATNSVGDIIFGRSRTNTTNCRDNRSTRVNGAWYPVGRDGNGGTIYERRTTDSNGNVIIQRARRDSFGNMTIIGTRNAGNNGTWDNRRHRGDDDDDFDDDRDDDDRGRLSRRGHDRGGDLDDDRDDEDRGRINRRGDDRGDDFRFSNSENKGHGRGKGRKGRD